MSISIKNIFKVINPSKLLIMSVEQNLYDLVEILLEEGHADPKTDNSICLQCASEKGNFNIVELLLDDKRCDPKADDSYCLKLASDNGHGEIFQLLLEDGRADPNVRDCLRSASEKGHEDIVRILLKDGRSDPTYDDSNAFRLAVHNGCFPIVHCFILDGRVNQKDTYSQCLQLAIEKEHENMATLIKTELEKTKKEKNPIYITRKAMKDENIGVIINIWKNNKRELVPIIEEIATWACKTNKPQLVLFLLQQR